MLRLLLYVQGENTDETFLKAVEFDEDAIAQLAVAINAAQQSV